MIRFTYSTTLWLSGTTLREDPLDEYRDDEVNVDVEVSIHPSERQTHLYPGCDQHVEDVLSVSIPGVPPDSFLAKTLTLDPDFLSRHSEYILEQYNAEANDA